MVAQRPDDARAAPDAPFFMSAMSAVLTAIAICTGSWRGTTLVTMMTALSSSSCVVRVALLHPLAEDVRRARREREHEQHEQREQRLARVGRELRRDSIICISSPCALEKPARSTYASARRRRNSLGGETRGRRALGRRGVRAVEAA